MSKASFKKTLDGVFTVISVVGVAVTIKGLFQAEKVRRKELKAEQFKREQLARIEQKLDKLLNGEG